MNFLVLKVVGLVQFRSCGGLPFREYLCTMPYIVNERDKLLVRQQTSFRWTKFASRRLSSRKDTIMRKKAQNALRKWGKNVGKTRIREIISVRDTIMSKEEYVLNYFNNRSADAAAESFNAKIKGLRAQVHGVRDLPFFMFRCFRIFG